MRAQFFCVTADVVCSLGYFSVFFFNNKKNTKEGNDIKRGLAVPLWRKTHERTQWRSQPGTYPAETEIFFLL
jgi:hypothetical protein